MQGLLNGLTVIDASTIIGGPLSALLLAEYGATVIKVEHPGRGDGARNMGRSPHHKGYWWKFLSHNKKSVTCNLSHPDGAELFKGLCARADVLVENFRPGTLERWGLGYEELSRPNPGLVMLRVTGFGQEGPYAPRPGYGTVAEAMSGFAHMTGEADGPPTLPGMPLADALTGVMGAEAVLAALWARDRRHPSGDGDGKGQVIDLSLYGSLLFAFGMFVVEYDKLGIVPRREGNHYSSSPRNARECADGRWVAYSAVAESNVAAAVRVAGLAEDPRFQDHASTLEHGEVLDEALGRWIAERNQSEAVEGLSSAGVPCAPVYDIAQLIDDPHVKARGDLITAEDPDGEQFLMPRGPARYSRATTQNGPAGPALGEHNDEVYAGWLGLDPSRLSELEAAGVI